MNRRWWLVGLALWVLAGCDPAADSQTVTSSGGPPPPPPPAAAEPAAGDSAVSPSSADSPSRANRGDELSVSPNAGDEKTGDRSRTEPDGSATKENPLADFGYTGPLNEGEAPKFLPADERNSADRTAQYSISLSAGVALPQSLPTGTAMGFAIDYQFVGPGPGQSSRYLWVITAAKDPRPWSQVVRLQSQGSLQIFVREWRPEHGPFETMIVEQRPDGTKRQVSAKESL